MVAPVVVKAFDVIVGPTAVVAVAVIASEAVGRVSGVAAAQTVVVVVVVVVVEVEVDSGAVLVHP